MSSMIVRRKSLFPVKGVAWCLSLIVVALAGRVGAAPRIELAEFTVEPATLKLGESFMVRARAVATGTALGSFLLRTAEEVAREDEIPGFPLYANGNYYVEEDGKYFLKDNGTLDGDPRDAAFALEVSTRGWNEGVYTFAFFASCRPAPGPFIVARRDFAVVIHGEQVRIEDLGQAGVITSFSARPEAIAPGTPVTLSLRLARLAAGVFKSPRPTISRPRTRFPASSTRPPGRRRSTAPRANRWSQTEAVQTKILRRGAWCCGWTLAAGRPEFTTCS